MKPVKRPPTLKAAARALNQTHARVGAHQAAALEHAIECGAILHYAKSLVAHGEWSGWLSENFSGSRQTADLYRKIAAAKSQNFGIFESVSGVGEAAQLARSLSIPDDLPAELPGLMMPPKPVAEPENRPSAAESLAAEASTERPHIAPSIELPPTPIDLGVAAAEAIDTLGRLIGQLASAGRTDDANVIRAAQRQVKQVRMGLHREGVVNG